jgi:hypothetical protein
VGTVTLVGQWVLGAPELRQLVAARRGATP